MARLSEISVYGMGVIFNPGSEFVFRAGLRFAEEDGLGLVRGMGSSILCRGRGGVLYDGDDVRGSDHRAIYFGVRVYCGGSGSLDFVRGAVVCV